jgi:phosphatidylglycerol---prolipoprotein diacylglyceryl transferase
LYEIAFLAVFWWLIVCVKNRLSPLPGESFKLLMVGYFGFRFCIEFLKNREQYFAGLGAIQITCLTALIYYIDYIVLIYKRTFQPALQQTKPI